MKRLSKWGSVAAAVGGLLLVAGAASAASPYSAPLIAYWNGSSWAQQASPNPDGSGSLTAVAVVSVTDVWAVGSYGMHGKALAEHWDGSSWQQVAMPTPSGANEVRLYGLAAISKTNVWAVGSWAGPGTHRSGYRTLVEHWDGNSWAIMASRSPGISTQLFGLAALSKSNVWAVGYSETAVAGLAHFHTLVLHWNGKKWQQVASPHPGYHGFDSRLAGVAAVSPQDVWAVGTYYRVQHGKRSHPTLVLHWNGKKWKQVSSPDRGSFSQLVAAAALGRNNVWAVGYSQSSHEAGSNGIPSGMYGGVGHSLIERWNGHTWRIVPAHSGYLQSRYEALTSLAVVKGNDIWAAGQQQDTASLSHSTLSHHWNGKAWSPVSSPNPAPDNWFSGIAAASPKDVWAVGTYFPAP